MTIVRSGNEQLCDVKTFQNYFFYIKIDNIENSKSTVKNEMVAHRYNKDSKNRNSYLFPMLMQHIIEQQIPCIRACVDTHFLS